MRWTIALILPAFWLLLVSPCQAQYVVEKPPSGPPKKAEPAKPGTLDQLIAEAMKNNPDIRVADAKLREAEAEAHRARLKVAAEVATLHGDISSARAAEEEGLIRYERAKEQFRLKAISSEDLAAARATYLKLQKELSSLQAKLPFLLGRQPGVAGGAAIDDAILKKWISMGSDHGISDVEYLRRVTLDVIGRLPTAEETKDYLKLPEKDRRAKWLDQILQAEAKAQVGAWKDTMACIRCHGAPMRLTQWMNDPHHDRDWVAKAWGVHFNVEPKTGDKLRKALDGKLTVEFEKSPLGEVLEYLRERGGLGVNIHIRAKGLKEQAVTVNLREPVAIGAVLQFLEDEMKVVFVLRDYGIVVSGSEDRLPPGAVRVVDFWKHEPPAKQSDPLEKSKTPSEKTKADATNHGSSIRAAVTAIDPKDAMLVEISVGTDAGAVKGKFLEVFRLMPEAKYMGQVEVLEATATRCVARQVAGGSAGMIQPGDLVVAKIVIAPK